MGSTVRVTFADEMLGEGYERDEIFKESRKYYRLYCKYSQRCEELEKYLGLPPKKFENEMLMKDFEKEPEYSSDFELNEIIKEGNKNFRLYCKYSTRCELLALKLTFLKLL